MEKFYKKVHKTDSCWLWTGNINIRGYGVFWFRGKKSNLAHRASYIIHKGEIPDGLCVCHTCDIRHCVNPDHLWLGTRKDNNQDCVRKGRLNSREGTKNPRSKLTESQVKEILTSDLSLKELAENFNVTDKHIGNIKARRCWKHL